MLNSCSCDWLVSCVSASNSNNPSFHWITSANLVNGNNTNGNVVNLPSPIPLNLWLRVPLCFSISLGRKQSTTSATTRTPALVKTSLLSSFSVYSLNGFRLHTFFNVPSCYISNKQLHKNNLTREDF